MITAPKQLFDNVQTWKDLQTLLQSQQEENEYLECKDHRTNALTKDVQTHIAKAISGFSNTSGGVLIFGAETSNKSGADLIVQFNKIANIQILENNIRKEYIQFVEPVPEELDFKIIKERSTDSAGVLLLLITQTTSDPIKSLKDQTYYIRTGDDFKPAPHSFLKKMFLRTDSPDLVLSIDLENQSSNENVFNIPLLISNNSYKVARDVKIMIAEKNGIKRLQALSLDGFQDYSKLNNSRKVVGSKLLGPFYKYLPAQLGEIKIDFLERKRYCLIEMDVYAENFIPKKFEFKIRKQKNRVELVSFSEKELRS